MQFEIILGSAIAVVAILLLVLKTNAAVVFFSVCAGSVLANQLGGQVSLWSSTVIKDGDINKSVAYIALIILPGLLSALFLRRSVHTSKLFFNLLPSIATGALLALLIIPLLPGSISSNILASDAWSLLQKYQPVVLVGGVVASILLLWVTRAKDKKDKKHKK